MRERMQWALLALAFAGGCLLAEPTSAAAEKQQNDEIDPRVTEILHRMDQYLERQPAFSVTIDTGYDVVQAWGQKMEFGETRDLTVRRPDRLRLEVTDRDGSEDGVVFDGKDLTVFDQSEHTFARAPKTGSIDDAVSYFVQDLAMRLPMASVFSGDLSGQVKGWADRAFLVEAATIAGVPCDHLSLSGPWENVQFWIAKGDRPLLQRMVITYKQADEQPQFWAQLRDWDVSVSPPDSVFSFSPAAGMTKIAFTPLAQKELRGSVRPTGDERGVEP